MDNQRNNRIKTYNFYRILEENESLLLNLANEKKKEKYNTLINAKIDSVNAFGIKMQRTQNISLNKRLNDLYLQMSSIEGNLNDAKKLIKTLKQHYRDETKTEEEKTENMI